MNLEIFAERLGKSLKVGTITTSPGYGESFAYADDWLDERGSRPLSLSLPLQSGPFPAKAIRPYFDGLLPEGAARAAIARRLHVSSAAYLKILASIGRECVGAVSFCEQRDVSDDAYVEVDEDKLAMFAEQSYPCAAETSERAHFSLAGSQAKIALYRSVEGRWYEPQGFVPSTHILKPASSRFEGVAANEAICTIAAGRCGIDVPNIEVLDFGRPVICTKRFDRAVPASGRFVDGLPVPLRLHQEDFCQASCMVPEHKYEEGQRSNLVRIAELLRENATNPPADLTKLWDMTVFNYLIGNCDAHLKNIAIIRDASWNELRIAPAYDLLCTSCYEGLSTSLAMSIGSARHTEDVTPASFAELASDLHIPKSGAMGRMEQLAQMVPDMLGDVAAELEHSGVECAPLVERITAEAKKNAHRLLP